MELVKWMTGWTRKKQKRLPRGGVKPMPSKTISQTITGSDEFFSKNSEISAFYDLKYGEGSYKKVYFEPAYKKVPVHLAPNIPAEAFVADIMYSGDDDALSHRDLDPKSTPSWTQAIHDQLPKPQYSIWTRSTRDKIAGPSYKI